MRISLLAHQLQMMPRFGRVDDALDLELPRAEIHDIARPHIGFAADEH